MQRNLAGISPTLLKNIKQLFLFNDIVDDTLISCLQGVEEIHMLKGELIFRKGESYHKGIYFVISGMVKLATQSDFIDVRSGGAVGISTFLGKTMYTVTATAEADSDILFVDEYSIYSLMDKAPEFREKFMHHVMERLNNLERMTTRTISLSTYQSVGGCMSSPLITLHNSKTITDAARMMIDHNVGAIVIMNRKHVLKGVLTSKNIAHKYLSNPLESPNEALAENYANHNPLMLPQEYPLTETLSEMLRRGEDYALITRRNKLVGIISKTDILRLLANGSDVFGATVSKVKEIPELLQMDEKMPRVAENMMNNTSLFRDFLPTLSANHLLIIKKVSELTKQQYKKDTGFEVLTSNFSMMSLGSMARRELSLCKVQEGAMVLKDGLSDEETLNYKTFAKKFASNLSSIGYEPSNMGMSLDNPDMVKTISEWKEYVSVNIHKSNETNTPYTRVLLDCEYFEGDGALFWEFKDAIHATLKEKVLFFGRLLNVQSTAKIPVTPFGGFITEKDGKYKDTIDLKENAFDFISYTAQAFGLYSDILDINTVKRVDHLGRKLMISEELVKETISAYESLVDLLIHEQLRQSDAGEAVTYKIYPAKLSMHSQEQLKRALQIIARFFGEGLNYFNK